jgi:hypothetical protein
LKCERAYVLFNSKICACLIVLAVRQTLPVGVVTAVAIYKLISNGSFGPDEIEVMKAAYEVDVGVTDRDDLITELIAKAIVNVTASGERNPKEVMERALNALGVRRSAA